MSLRVERGEHLVRHALGGLDRTLEVTREAPCGLGAGEMHASDRLTKLFAEGGHAVASLLIENPTTIEPRQAVTIELEAEDLEGLFVDWLSELIYRFETEHLLLREFSLSVTDSQRGLRADCRGEPVDWNRHEPGYELKAVTYHGLRVAQTATGWEASVIFDV